MKKIIIILLAVATIGLSGCEKWLDINKNPNDAISASPELILPGVLKTWAQDVLNETTPMGAWMGYWAHAGGWSGWYDLKKYEITSNTGNLPSRMYYYYSQLTDNKFIRDNSGTYVIYPAITKVVDAWYYARLIDLYNDIPYTEACQPDVTLTPVYDDAETVWMNLITKLDEAIVVFDSAANALDHTTNTIYTFKATTDIINSADFNLWAKMANTLKLRLVMRLTNVKSVAELTALMANTDSYGYITTNIKSKLTYAQSSGKQNPWWNSFGRGFDNTLAGANTQYILNSYFYRKLTLLTDPRLAQFFFAPTATYPTIVHMLFGTDGDLVAQPNSTRAANYSWVLIANNWSIDLVNHVNLGNGATDQSSMFLASEAYFLQAEAAARGIIASTTADVAYTAGITASLNDAEVSAANQTDYLDNAGVMWDGAWDQTEQIRHIINQKYIANYFLNHFESYCDYRRTTYPNPIHPGYTNDAINDPLYEMLSFYPSGVIRRQIPRILPYPQTELDLNKVNCQAAIDKMLAAHPGVTFVTSSYPFDARVFWDTAPTDITTTY